MTERTNHTYEARRIIRAADANNSAEWAHQTGEQKADMLAAAQVHATLALVEQQRVANLIALAGRVDVGVYDSVADEEGYVRGREVTPAIREALGL